MMVSVPPGTYNNHNSNNGQYKSKSKIKTKHLLLVTFHHSIIDYWSLQIFEADLQLFYHLLSKLTTKTTTTTTVNHTVLNIEADKENQNQNQNQNAIKQNQNENQSLVVTSFDCFQYYDYSIWQGQVLSSTSYLNRKLELEKFWTSK